MANVQSIKEKIDKAHELQNASTGVYRKWKETYNAEVSKIRSNRNLTEEGKFKLKERMTERKTVELMQLSKKQIEEYRKILSEAYKEADRIANAKPKTADPVKAERFEKSFGEVKISILLASPEKAIKILQEFVDATDEPALVDRIRAEFAAVVAPVIAQAKPEQKHKLNDLFDFTRYKAKGPEVIEAEQLMQTAEALRNSRFYELAVGDSVLEVHKEAQRYLNQPDEFFEKYPGTETLNTSLRSQEEVIAEIDGGNE